MENIICAAILYKELETQKYLPKNIDTGVVVCGYRHHHCIDILNTLTGFRSVTKGPNSVGEYVQGFLTSDNRFVDRDEGWIIAEKNNQIVNKPHSRESLFSEDLY